MAVLGDVESARDVNPIVIAGLWLAFPDEFVKGAVVHDPGVRLFTFLYWVEVNVSSLTGHVLAVGDSTHCSRVNVTATPKTGFQFDKWSDGNTQATRTINVSQNLSLTALFKAVSSGGNTEPGGEDEEKPDFL